MSATLIKTIISADSRYRVCIYQSASGVFFFEEEWFRDYSQDEAFQKDVDMPPGFGAWQGDGRSGYYASAELAEHAAKMACQSQFEI